MNMYEEIGGTVVRMLVLIVYFIALGVLSFLIAFVIDKIFDF